MHSFAPSWRTIVRVTDVEEIGFALVSSPFSFVIGQVQIVGFHILIECVEVYVGPQGAHDTPLWCAGKGCLPFSLCQDTCTQKLPEEVSDVSVGYSFLDRFN